MVECIGASVHPLVLVSCVGHPAPRLRLHARRRGLARRRAAARALAKRASGGHPQNRGASSASLPGGCGDHVCAEAPLLRKAYAQLLCGVHAMAQHAPWAVAYTPHNSDYLSIAGQNKDDPHFTAMCGTLSFGASGRSIAGRMRSIQLDGMYSCAESGLANFGQHSNLHVSKS